MSPNPTLPKTLILALALALACPRLCAAQSRPATRPNIVLLLADDQRPDTIAALGNPVIRTPHLDALVRGGVAFRNAHIEGSMQPAVCVPSRAMLLTGRSLLRLEKTGSVIPPRQPTFPELLRQAGYATFAAGKWHNDRASFARSFTGGGAIFFGGMGDQAKVNVWAFDPTGAYAKGSSHVGAKYSTELFADEAVRFLREHKGDQPFYLHLAFTVPHDPRMIPPAYDGRYDPAKVPLPPNVLPQHPFDNGEMKVRDEALTGWPRSEAYVRREVAAYYAMIEHMDGQIGRVLTALKEAGHGDDTVVVFAADNGLALGSHGLLGKQNLYEHSVGVPLVIKGPGAAAGKTTDALCHLTDLCPTLLEFAGVAAPPGLDGRSLVPVLRGERDAHRDGLLFAYKNVQRGYRDERFKLIEYDVNGTRTTQLFDLRDDPHETKDLSTDPAHAETLARLRKQMTDAQRKAGDPHSRSGR